jgi:hypothetical protein
MDPDKKNKEGEEGAKKKIKKPKKAKVEVEEPEEMEEFNNEDPGLITFGGEVDIPTSSGQAKDQTI